MKTLQENMAGQEHQEQEMELFFSQKLAGLEKKWREEKNDLLARLRSKEEELHHQPIRHVSEMEKASAAFERQLHELERGYEERIHEEKEKALAAVRERDMINERLDEKEQEFITLKAQLALIHSQVKLEKDKLSQSWQEAVRLKEEEVAAFKNRIAEQEAEREKTIQKRLDEADQKWAAERSDLQAALEKERTRRNESEADLRIRVSEESARREKAEEQVVFLQQRHVSDDSAEKQKSEQLAHDLQRREAAHAKEREIWKNALQAIEGKLAAQKQERYEKNDNDQSQNTELKIKLAEQAAAVKKVEEEYEELKNKYWDERDNWGRIASVKDEELQRMFERADALEQAQREREARYWEEKEAYMKEHEARYRDENEKHCEEIRGILAEKDAAIEREKGNVADEIKKNARLSQEVACARMNVREQVEREFRDVLAQLEKKNHDWAENIRKQYEGASTLKERALREELKAIKAKMTADLHELENAHQNEKEKLREEIARKEKERISAIQSAEKQYVQKIEYINKELRLKEQQLETFRKLHNDSQQASALEKANEQLQHKMQEIEQLQHKAEEVTQLHQQELSELNQKVHEEHEGLESLEHRFVSSQKPKTLLGKIWEYLNRTVVVVSIRRGFRAVR